MLSSSREKSVPELLQLCSRGDAGLIGVKYHCDRLSAREIERTRDAEEASCLHYAVRASGLQLLEYFVLERQVTPHLVSQVGATILHDAAVNGDLAAIQWILDHTSLSISAKDADGANIAHLAAKFDHLHLIEWLVAERGSSLVKEQTYTGATCLHYACASNAFKSLARLVQVAPSLLNVQMVNGVTAFYLACQEDNLSIVRLLAHAGALVHMKANDGVNPLHVASQNGSLAIARLLVEEFAANVNEPDFEGTTPLHYACLSSSSRTQDLVVFYLTQGASMLQDKDGNSALHCCALTGAVHLARLLVSQNFNVALRNVQQKTCVDLALDKGHFQFVNEFHKFQLMHQNVSSIAEGQQKTREHSTVTKTKQQPASYESILSPLNSLNSLKLVSTSTPQDFITIVSDLDVAVPEQRQHAKPAEESSTNKVYAQHKMSRNQSILKIVSHAGADLQQPKAEQTPNTTSCNAYKQLDRTESIQSETLAELNNCIAQFEKFSYFTNETFKNDKEVCFTQISNKLNEIKNTLIETKNKQMSQSQTYLVSDSILSDSSIQSMSEVSNMTSELLSPRMQAQPPPSTSLSQPPSSKVVGGFVPPPPPPPPLPPVNLFANQAAKLKPVSRKTSSVINDDKNQRGKASASSSGTSTSTSTLRSSLSSSSFMQELQSKLQTADMRLKKTNSSVKLTATACDLNNNSTNSADFNSTNGGGGEELRLGEDFFLRKKQAEVPEWKQRLIEKKRQSRMSLGAGGW